MNALVPKHASQAIGELSGWDRMVVRGTLRMLSFVSGMMGYLSRVGVLLKNFGEHSQAMTERLIDASLAAAYQAERPVERVDLCRALQKHDNSFSWIEGFAKAQAMMDRMHNIPWPSVLDVVARRSNPAHGRMFRSLGMSDYGSAFQTEWATDPAFESPAALARIYAQLVRGAIATYGSHYVLPFLAKRPDPRYQGEVLSDYKDRPEDRVLRAVGPASQFYLTEGRGTARPAPCGRAMSVCRRITFGDVILSLS